MVVINYFYFLCIFVILVGGNARVGSEHDVEENEEVVRQDAVWHQSEKRKRETAGGKTPRR